MSAYTTFGLDGATVTHTRPHGFAGRPFADAAVRSCHVSPPSSLLNRPLPLAAAGPSPPERNVQPLRRKSHIPANSVRGCVGSIDTDAQPVEAFGPFNTSFHVFPASFVR